MRAVAITDDRRVAVVDLERPQPGVGEVLLDVEYCGICGTDLHLLQFPPELAPPGLVPGHEFTGVIAAAGRDVTGWEPGERVAVFPSEPCGACPACRRGRPNLCETGLPRIPGFGRQGAYAESIAVPATMLRRLPATVSTADGALVEPLAVATRALNLSGASPDEAICVLGAGPIGVLAAIAARAKGFERVAVVEPMASRRALVERLGIPAVAPDDARDAVPELLGGAPETVLECSGHPSAAPLGVDLLPVAGRLMLTGMPLEPVPFDVIALAGREAVVRASQAYSDADFGEALELIATGRVPCDEIVTTIAPLEEAPAWFEDLVSATTAQVKVLLRPGADGI